MLYSAVPHKTNPEPTPNDNPEPTPIDNLSPIHNPNLDDDETLIAALVNDPTIDDDFDMDDTFLANDTKINALINIQTIRDMDIDTPIQIQHNRQHNTQKFLTSDSHARTPHLYLLPKIHKQDIPGRPIISGCWGPMVKLSQYADHLLKPLLNHIPSYIQDTTDFLCRILTLNTNLPQLMCEAYIPTYLMIRHPGLYRYVERKQYDNS